MPCRGPDEHEIAEWNRANLDVVTRCMCTTMKYLRDLEHDAKGAFYPYTNLLNSHPEVKRWWEQHQIVDRQREEAEQKRAALQAAKESALSKLTAEEAKLLGLVI